MVEEKIIPVSPVQDLSVQVDPALDRVRDIVVPDFRFLDLLTDQLGDGVDRLIFELLLGTGGRCSEVAGFRVGDVDFTTHRVWVREPVVEVEGSLVRVPVPKSGRHRAVIMGPTLARLMREHLLRLGMPGPDVPLLTSATGKGFRWVITSRGPSALQSSRPQPVGLSASGNGSWLKG